MCKAGGPRCPMDHKRRGEVNARRRTRDRATRAYRSGLVSALEEQGRDDLAQVARTAPSGDLAVMAAATGNTAVGEGLDYVPGLKRANEKVSPDVAEALNKIDGVEIDPDNRGSSLESMGVAAGANTKDPFVTDTDEDDVETMQCTTCGAEQDASAMVGTQCFNCANFGDNENASTPLPDKSSGDVEPTKITSRNRRKMGKRADELGAGMYDERLQRLSDEEFAAEYANRDELASIGAGLNADFDKYGPKYDSGEWGALATSSVKALDREYDRRAALHSQGYNQPDVDEDVYDNIDTPEKARAAADAMYAELEHMGREDFGAMDWDELEAMYNKYNAIDDAIRAQGDIDADETSGNAFINLDEVYYERLENNRRAKIVDEMKKRGEDTSWYVAPITDDNREDTYARLDDLLVGTNQEDLMRLSDTEFDEVYKTRRHALDSMHEALFDDWEHSYQENESGDRGDEAYDAMRALDRERSRRRKDDGVPAESSTGSDHDQTHQRATGDDETDNMAAPEPEQARANAQRAVRDMIDNEDLAYSSIRNMSDAYDASVKAMEDWDTINGMSQDDKDEIPTDTLRELDEKYEDIYKRVRATMDKDATETTEVVHRRVRDMYNQRVREERDDVQSMFARVNTQPDVSTAKKADHAAAVARRLAAMQSPSDYSDDELAVKMENLNWIADGVRARASDGAKREFNEAHGLFAAEVARREADADADVAKRAPLLADMDRNDFHDAMTRLGLEDNVRLGDGGTVEYDDVTPLGKLKVANEVRSYERFREDPRAWGRDKYQQTRADWDDNLGWESEGGSVNVTVEEDVNGDDEVLVEGAYALANRVPFAGDEARRKAGRDMTQRVRQAMQERYPNHPGNASINVNLDESGEMFEAAVPGYAQDYNVEPRHYYRALAEVAEEQFKRG